MSRRASSLPDTNISCVGYTSWCIRMLGIVLRLSFVQSTLGKIKTISISTLSLKNSRIEIIEIIFIVKSYLYCYYRILNIIDLNMSDISDMVNCIICSCII